MKRLFPFALLVLVAVFQQGCVAWRYTTTPVVTGRVVDADTGKAIVGAEVGFRKHEAMSTRTKEDGSFTLASDREWGPAFGIPFEFTPCGGVLYVAAPDYVGFENDVGQRVYHPVQLSDVALKKKEPNQPPQRNASTKPVSSLESPARRG